MRQALANSKKFDHNSANFFLKYLIALAVHNPSVLPILCQVAKENDIGPDLEIMPVLKQSIKLLFVGEPLWWIGMLIALNQYRKILIIGPYRTTCVGAFFISTSGLKFLKDKNVRFINSINSMFAEQFITWARNMPFPTKLILPITLILLSLAIGCDQEAIVEPLIGLGEDNIEILIIGPYRTTCVGAFPQECYLEFNEERQDGCFSMKVYADLNLSRGISIHS